MPCSCTGPSYSSATGPHSIPDGSGSSVVDIVVSDVGSVAEIYITIDNLVHTWLSDLVCTLTHVDTGTTVNVFNRIGGGSENSDFNGDYSFGDACTDSIWTAAAAQGSTGIVPTGSYYPTNISNVRVRFDTFNGESIVGTWRLTFSDVVSSDVGSYNQWTICFGLIGGVVLGGSAPVESGLFGSGGVVVGGEALVEDAPAGVEVNGAGNNQLIAAQVGSGGAVLAGTASTGETTTQIYVATGGITLLDSATVNFEFFLNIDFEWVTRSVVEVDMTFTWNTGFLAAYWFRIIGKGVQGDVCGPLQADPCCQKFIVNIHARTLAELCEKLSRRQYNFPIESVQRFSRPAETSVVEAEEEAGIDHSCNKLEPVEVCDIPQCAEFCVSHDVRASSGFFIRVSLIGEEFYVAEGQAFVSGAAGVVFDPNNNEYDEIGSGGAELAGAVAAHYFADGSGSIIADGDADEKINPVNIVAEGGVEAAGIADVEPYYEIPEGGAEVGYYGQNVFVYYNITASGGIAGGGLANLPVVVLNYPATGSVFVEGESSVVSTSWSWFPTGNVVVIGGDSDYMSSDLGQLNQISTFSMTIFDLNAEFGSDIHEGDAEAVIGNLTKCGCIDIPFGIELTNNLARNNLFASFLVRNNFDNPARLRMKYNTVNDSWQVNLHYRGLSSDSNTQETWTLVFDLQCTNEVGGTVLGSTIWKLGGQIVRKNLTTLEDFETRFVVSVLPEPICSINNNQVDFEVTYDTQLNFALTDPNATIYQSTLLDKIGLFRNRGWIDDPELIIGVSQLGSGTPITRVDVTDDVLVEG